MKIVYISYDGLTDPLGQSQVIPYVIGLSKRGYAMTVLSYEKQDNFCKFKEEVSMQLTKNNVEWKPMRYHSRFSIISTVFDLLQGMVTLRMMVKQDKVNIVHCRSYVAAFLGYMLRKHYGVKFIFDMRGFWADERKDAGMVQTGFVYSQMKRFEKKFLLKADSIISLTHAAISEMKSWPYMGDREISKCTQITTCCDIASYKHAYKINLARKIENGCYKLLYIGSIGPWHSLKELCNFMKFTYHYLPNSSFKLVVNQGVEQLRSFIEQNQLDVSRFTVESISHNKLPQALQDFDIGFFFIPPKYAKIASSPTKMGEMLAAGLPIITGYSIGDVDNIVETNNIGYVMKSFDEKNYRNALDHLTNMIGSEGQVLSQRCFKVAQDHFSLENAVNKYAAIYSKLIDKSDEG